MEPGASHGARTSEGSEEGRDESGASAKGLTL